MSTSWLRRSVRTVNSRTARILGSGERGGTLGPRLDGYRAGADRFLAELDEEYYLHYAGLKPELELRRSTSATPTCGARDVRRSASRSAAARTRSSSASAARPTSASSPASTKIAELEASLETPHDGGAVGYRMLPPTIANTADRATRARLEQARNELTEEHLNPLYLEAVQTRSAPFRSWAPRPTSSSTATASTSTSRASQHSAAPSSTRRSGSTRSRWTACCASGRHRPRGGRAARRAPLLPRLELGRRLPGRPDGARAAGTLAGLGIDLDAQANVHLDVEERPTKSPRAFCAAIEIPDKVMLVIQPQGGRTTGTRSSTRPGTRALRLHSRDLRVEEKRLGDNAVTEGWAMLFDHLVDDRAWLSSLLDFPRPETFAAEGAVRSSSSSAATARSSCTRSSSTPRPT